MASTDLIQLRPQGLYCAAGGFWIDPWMLLERWFEVLARVLAARELGARARLPVFWLRCELGVLPAFGRMTGLAMIDPVAADRIVAVVGDELLALRAAALVD